MTIIVYPERADIKTIFRTVTRRRTDLDYKEFKSRSFILSEIRLDGCFRTIKDQQKIQEALRKIGRVVPDHVQFSAYTYPGTSIYVFIVYGNTSAPLKEQNHRFRSTLSISKTRQFVKKRTPPWPRSRSAI